ncbi:MAG: hypothetical protein U9R16_07300 [Campylobacterota bacterium]|nr:hypothetical protein [Campylobacterota bacterium]
MNNKYNNKTRIIIVSLFTMIILFQVRDVLIEYTELSVLFFIIIPILIYLYTLFLWKKRKNNF